MSFVFNDHIIHWRQLPGLEYIDYFILNIDPQTQTYDVLFRLHAGQQIVLHRHLVRNHTFVIQGEHRLYHADGSVKEIRPTGSYTVSPASNDPHREGGGSDQDAVVFFSIRGTDGPMYEILDDAMNVTAVIGGGELTQLYQAQNAP